MSHDPLSAGAVKVRDYMTTEVDTVEETDSVRTAADLMRGVEAHSGLPVVDVDERVAGFVSARDLLFADDDAPVGAVMSRDIIVARPEMKVKNAARVILRSGIQRLPVVGSDDRLVGIISHADIVRSQIEHTSPRKVKKLKRMLESVHDADIEIREDTVSISEIIPTQEEVYADELEGRKYEIEQGLVEPIVAIEYGDEVLLADGHHRALAASRIDRGEMQAYVVTVDRTEVDLGMRQTAREAGLSSLDDIEVNDYAHHPLVEKTEKWQSSDEE